jgi:hypothetical protein
MRRLDARFIHHAETIAAYGGPLGTVKEEETEGLDAIHEFLGSSRFGQFRAGSRSQCQ